MFSIFFTIKTYNRIVRYTFFFFAIACHEISLAQSESSSEAGVMMFRYVGSDESANKVLNRSLPNNSLLKNSRVKTTQGLDAWEIEQSSQVRDLQEGDILQVPLPNGDVLSVEIKVRQVMSNGDIQLRAPIGSGGGIVLTANKNIMFANIISVEKNINMSIGVNDLQEQVIVDQDTLPIGSVDFSDDMVVFDEQTLHDESTLSSEFTTKFNAQAATSDVSNLDVLFVYSPEFAQTFTDPDARINQLVGHSNLSYDNTGVLINMRVAGAVELNIDNSASILALLEDAQDGLNGFESVADLRNQLGGDLVAVLTSQPGNSSSGIAFVGNFFENFDTSFLGFSSTRLSPNCCDVVFTHEIGHNLGSGHERTSVNPDQNQACTGGATGFSCGHGSLQNDWGTIMTSSSNLDRNRIGPQFSNLINSCLGEACGVAEGLANAADNQSSFNMTRFNVSAFREEVNPPLIFLPPVYDLLLNQ